MKCRIIHMRREGVALPKHTLKQAVYQEGELVIMDVRDEGVNRVIKTARLTDRSYRNRHVDVLYEPHIVWMNEGRFTLQGFERVLKDGKIIEYAQSWLCQIEEGMT